jgi:hypothetical protein
MREVAADCDDTMDAGWASAEAHAWPCGTYEQIFDDWPFLSHGDGETPRQPFGACAPALKACLWVVPKCLSVTLLTAPGLFLQRASMGSVMAESWWQPLNASIMLE